MAEPELIPRRQKPNCQIFPVASDVLKKNWPAIVTPEDRISSLGTAAYFFSDIQKLREKEGKLNSDMIEVECALQSSSFSIVPLLSEFNVRPNGLECSGAIVS